MFFNDKLTLDCPKLYIFANKINILHDNEEKTTDGSLAAKCHHSDGRDEDRKLARRAAPSDYH